MKKNILTAALFTTLMSVTAMKCHKHDVDTSPCSGVACTAMFAMVNMNVTDSNGNKVSLDNAYTIKVGTTDTIRHDQSTSFDGSYIVLDDNYQKKMVNSNYNFRFIGIKSGKVVVDETYNIEADCCHINKISGKSSVIVN